METPKPTIKLTLNFECPVTNAYVAAVEKIAHDEFLRFAKNVQHMAETIQHNGAVGNAFTTSSKDAFIEGSFHKKGTH